MSERTIAYSVRQLDLRSVKENSSENLRKMMVARREALNAISAAPSPNGMVIRPATTSSGSKRSPQGIQTLRRIHTEPSVPAPAPQVVVDEAALAEAAAAKAELETTKGTCSQLEASLIETCQAFASYVESTETSTSGYYCVSFPAGAIGSFFSVLSVPTSRNRSFVWPRPLTVICPLSPPTLFLITCSCRYDSFSPHPG